MKLTPDVTRQLVLLAQPLDFNQRADFMRWAETQPSVQSVRMSPKYRQMLNASASNQVIKNIKKK